MAINPMISLTIATAGVIFIGAIYGGPLGNESNLAKIDPPSMNSPGCNTFLGLGDFACGIIIAISFVINIFIILFQGLVFLFNAVTFNVPGAPWYARTFIGSILGGSVLISILSFIRGN